MTDDVIEFKPKRKRRGNKGGEPPPAEDGRGPEDCPVMPLGHRGGTYFFFSRVGEYRTATPRDLTTAAGLLSLFEGQSDWLVDFFPLLDRQGRRTGMFDPLPAGRWLISACADPKRAGLFDESLPVRGPGVWRDRDGGLIVHAGTHVEFRGTWQRAGLKRDEALYPAAPAVPLPDRTPAAPESGRRLLEHLRLRWRFELELGAEIVLGWIGQAMLGGAPDWRVHLYVTAKHGSGKTWLTNMVSGALGGGAHPGFTNFSEAGLRQAFTQQARAIVLDEAEHDPANSRVRTVIELLRQMSGGEGARVARGSSGGRAQSFSVTGCAYLSSILHVPLLPADRSRILVLRLGELPVGDVDGAEAAKAAIREMEEASAGLRARAIAGWARFQLTLTSYRRAFIQLGCEPRMADTFAAVLAGRDLLVADMVPTEEHAYDEALRFQPLVSGAAIDREEGEGQSCLNWLYSSTLENWRAGERLTVGQLVMEGLQEAAQVPTGADGQRQATAATQKLGAAGLRIVEDGYREWTLLVANQHVALQRVFHETRWRDGAWQQALRYLPGAKPWPKPARFAGILQRATAVPKRLLPQDGGSELDAVATSADEAYGP